MRSSYEGWTVEEVYDEVGKDVLDLVYDPQAADELPRNSGGEVVSLIDNEGLELEYDELWGKTVDDQGEHLIDTRSFQRSGWKSRSSQEARRQKNITTWLRHRNSRQLRKLSFKIPGRSGLRISRQPDSRTAPGLNILQHVQRRPSSRNTCWNSERKFRKEERTNS